MKAEIQPLRVLVKALSLFVVVNVLYALVGPQGSSISAYNFIFPGRVRLPFGITGDPYTVTDDDVDVMFATHAISAPKGDREYRVVLLGDSSIWGDDLAARETISEQWNTLNVQCENRTIKTYNLGYPHPSVLKDLVILDKAMDYDPDLIVWFVTLNTLISQRVNPFLAGNSKRALDLLDAHHIAFERSDALRQSKPDFFQKTLIGQRSNLARQIKLQMLGMVWAATGADVDPASIHNEVPSEEVADDPLYRGMQPPADVKAMLLFSALAAGQEIAGRVPVLIVNEPIYITAEDHSTMRYNNVYPRWAYDQYRQYLADQAHGAGWNYLDLWDAVPPDYFSDAGLHPSAAGERLLAQRINPALRSMACDSKP